MLPKATPATEAFPPCLMAAGSAPVLLVESLVVPLIDVGGKVVAFFPFVDAYGLMVADALAAPPPEFGMDALEAAVSLPAVAEARSSGGVFR